MQLVVPLIPKNNTIEFPFYSAEPKIDLLVLPFTKMFPRVSVPLSAPSLFFSNLSMFGQKTAETHFGTTSNISASQTLQYSMALLTMYMGGTTQFLSPFQFCVKQSIASAHE